MKGPGEAPHHPADLPFDEAYHKALVSGDCDAQCVLVKCSHFAYYTAPYMWTVCQQFDGEKKRSESGVSSNLLSTPATKRSITTQIQGVKLHLRFADTSDKKWRHCERWTGS